jgi:hypothetical protein
MVRVMLPTQFEADLRGGPESNIAPFTLRPAFALDAAGSPQIVVGARTNNGVLTTTTITVTLVPDVGRRQDVSLLMNEIGAAVGAVPQARTIPAPSREQDLAETTNTIVFALNAIRRTKYLVRVRIDGAETDLLMTGGVYDRPMVDLT